MDYARELLETYTRMGLEREEVWSEFITAFRPKTIKLWDRETITIWYEFLKKTASTWERTEKHTEVTTSSIFYTGRTTSLRLGTNLGKKYQIQPQRRTQSVQKTYHNTR